ncbi:MAG: fibronectin type III domain-containing protein [Clostridia bacterium]|nr:fibronectin type III domain-containing protein [Clostridia bacterium]MBQ8616237.1 fibronectin type III domain-containing protein [Clostridia bacterium]
MATRTIIAHESSNAVNLIPESTGMLFVVDSDTGPIEGGKVATAAICLSNSDVLETASPTRLSIKVKYNSRDSEILAETGYLKGVISDTYIPTISEQDALATDEVSEIFLTIGLEDADKYTALYVYEGCTLTLVITCASKCGTPGNIRLSASQSSGSVVLQWSAAADGDGNAVRYYEVERQESANGGSTWGPMVSMGTTTNLYKVVSPPQTVGNMYRFLVRAVGTAGDDFASYWAQSGTLTKILPVLAPYTDPVITAGVTKVKAAHITELQTNINTVRAAYNWSAYTFTPVTAQYTGLAGWNAHITELRKAIDDVSTSHETWLALGDNCPRADVLEQLRRVVEAVAND